MAKIQSWEVSDVFWKKVEPLIPPVQREPNKTYKRKAGGGKKPMPPRRIFEAIMYVLRTENTPAERQKYIEYPIYFLTRY